MDAAEVVVRWEERENGVALVTVDRPKALNALNAAVLDQLTALFNTHAARSDLRAVVLTGAGRSFVAGADIAAMVSFSPAEAEAFAYRSKVLADAIEAMPVPVIAAVNGFALGGGCELAMCCDVILAGEKAKFGQPEVNLGVIPGFGGTQRLVRRVGMSHAMDLCLTGRIIGADEAVAMGLASRKIEGDVVEGALKVAEVIAAKGPVAVRLARRAILENADADLSTALAAERSLFALCFATSDQEEGMRAFLGKRPAAFTGQ